MRKSLRPIVIVVLSVGLVALFLRGAHLDVVWAEIKQANGWTWPRTLAATAVPAIVPAAALARAYGLI